jgi:hypothetical protein
VIRIGCMGGRPADKNVHGIADGDLTRLAHTHVDAPQIAMAQFGKEDQTQRIGPEAGAKLLAAIMRHGRDFKQRFTDAQPTAGRQIGSRKIEIEHQAIAEESEGLAIGDKLGNSALHDGNLHVGLATGGAAPGIAGNAAGGIEPRRDQTLTPASIAAPHQQSHTTDILCR